MTPLELALMMILSVVVVYSTATYIQFKNRTGGRCSFMITERNERHLTLECLVCHRELKFWLDHNE